MARIFDLCSGIGAFRMAGEELGHESVGYAEFDKFARRSYENIYNTTQDWTAWDIEEVTNEQWKELRGEVDWITGGFPCFAAGTLILTKKGLKPIEEIRKGDYVLTHNNQFKSVVIPMKKYKKGIYELKIQGSPTTLVTEEHPYYVREMKNQFDKRTKKEKKLLGKPQWVTVKELDPKRHMVGYALAPSNENPYSFTQDELFLLGRFAGDGFIPDREKETNPFAMYFQVGNLDKLAFFERKIKDYSHKVLRTKSGFVVALYDRRIYYLAKISGLLKKEKEILPTVLHLQSDLLRHFLLGFLGTSIAKKTTNKVLIHINSLPFLLSLSHVIQKTYRIPTFVEEEAKKKVFSKESGWILSYDKDIESIAINLKDDMVWLPIEKKKHRSRWEGTVYNMEVEDDNSYVANNAVVHNCQAFSVAGKGEGFNDPRGTVFFHVARAIEHVQPQAFILENVKNLISHDKGNTIDTIIGTLNDIGYTIDYAILNSKHYSVPQNRERVFIIGIKDKKKEEWTVQGNNVLAKSKRRIASYPWSQTFNFPFPTNDKVTNQLIDILQPEHEVPEHLYLSSEKTQTLIESILKRDEKLGRTTAMRMLGLLDTKGQENTRRVYDPNGIAPTLTTMGGGNREPKILVAGNINPSGRGMNGQVYDAFGLAPTINTNKGEGTKIAYCPIYSPDKITTRQNGRRVKQDNEEMFTLTTQDRHGIVMYDKENSQMQTPDNYGSFYVVRKLTPKECWRLQAFPDDAYERAAEVNSFSQLYKQAGNSITVTVAKAIMEELDKYLNKGERSNE